MKTKTGRTTRLQKIWVEKLRDDYKATAMVVSSLEEFKTLLDTLGES